MEQKTCQERIAANLESTEEDLKIIFQQMGYEFGISEEEIEESDFHNPDNPFTELNNYGLAFDFVERDTFTDQEESFWRFQIAVGGPQYEYRFYVTHPESDHYYKVLYWLLDWFDGAYKYPNPEIAQAIWDTFIELVQH